MPLLELELLTLPVHLSSQRHNMIEIWTMMAVNNNNNNKSIKKIIIIIIIIINNKK
jgi:hypothetical protein